MAGSAFDYSSFRINLHAVDKLRAMRTFTAIADAGSLTAAARAQGGSLPGVVRSLAALEDELGTRLFNRTTRRISLTEAGHRYLERCREVLALVEDAEAELRAEQTEVRGKLGITAPVLFGERHVASGVTAFVQRHPLVSVEVQLLDRVVNLVEEGIDVGIRIGVLEDSSLIARPVAGMRRLTVAAPSYLARQGVPEQPKDLLSHNCIRYLRGGMPEWVYSVEGKRTAVAVGGNFSVNQTSVAAEACAAGLGVACLFAYQVAPLVASGALRVLLATFEAEPWPVHIVYPAARLLPARTRAFIDAMQHHLEREQLSWQVGSARAAPGERAAAPRPPVRSPKAGKRAARPPARVRRRG
jgi:DNA-binding transcriptional LysR family regulator